MDLSSLNLVLDFLLVAASVWMVITVRGIGGIVGRSLNLIVIGAIILGIAHLVATFAGGTYLNLFDSVTNNFIHRLIVLAGFIVLVFGFRQIRAIKD